MAARPPKPLDQPSNPRTRQRKTSSSLVNESLVVAHPPIVSADTSLYRDTDIHLLVGRAITLWQEVEHSLCTFFVEISTCSNPNVARSIFFTPRDFSDKISLVRNVSRFRIKGELRKEFEEIRKQIMKGSQVRNALAHFQLVHVHELPFGEKEIQSEYRLMPNILDPNEAFKARSSNEKPRSLNAEQIKNAANSFAALSSSIDSFSQKYRQLVASPK